MYVLIWRNINHALTEMHEKSQKSYVTKEKNQTPFQVIKDRSGISRGIRKILSMEITDKLKSAVCIEIN